MRCFIVVLALVLVSASEAEACGWVLWAFVKNLSTDAVFWNITPHAFEGKAECDAAARQRRAENRSESGRKYDELYNCFPAGTDPRPR